MDSSAMLVAKTFPSDLMALIRAKSHVISIFAKVAQRVAKAIFWLLYRACQLISTEGTRMESCAVDASPSWSNPRFQASLGASSAKPMTSAGNVLLKWLNEITNQCMKCTRKVSNNVKTELQSACCLQWLDQEQSYHLQGRHRKVMLGSF